AIGTLAFLVFVVGVSLLRVRRFAGERSRSFLQFQALTGILVVGALPGIVLAVAMPFLGWERHSYLYGMGVGLPTIATAYMITYQPLINIRGLLPRIGFYVMLATLSAGVLFALLQGYVRSIDQPGLPAIFFYAIGLVFVVLSAAVLLLHFLYQKSAVPFLFMRDAFVKERVLTGFAGEIQALEDTEESLE